MAAPNYPAHSASRIPHATGSDPSGIGRLVAAAALAALPLGACDFIPSVHDLADHGADADDASDSTESGSDYWWNVVRFDADDLARNFEQVVFFTETGTRAGETPSAPEPAPLRRWEQPVRVRMWFGDSVPEQERENDRASVAVLVDRLSRATRHPISLEDDAPTFFVFVLNQREREEFSRSPVAAQFDLPQQVLQDVETIPPRNACTVTFYNLEAPPSSITRAYAIIRAELPQRQRLSCFHEEIAQGLGATNDSYEARPSVFNDDGEYELLTHHDELLLRMLYDKRLQGGMDAAAARPIARKIAEELRPARPVR